MLSRHVKERPKQSWRKAQLKEWLDSKGTSFYLNMHDVNDGFCLILGVALKKDLWNAIKESRRPPEYVIDKMAEEKGLVLKLCIYNTGRS